MRRTLTFVLFFVILAAFASAYSTALAADDKATDKATDKVTDKAAEKAGEQAAAEKPAAPADRVVVMYFHRTKRCPTCLRMGTYSEASVKEKFADALKEGKVEFHYVDFQDKKNDALTKGYKVGGPTLIVAKVENNKLKEFKNLTDIWSKNTDEKEFFKYVQDNVNAYTR
jgi:thiol-disulfide isomerase/thioredoxin